MHNFEKLGAFYLGKTYDLAARKLLNELVLYDSKDLNTHAVIIGMTGSGKTGLGIGLLEEALIDRIPVIAIDPKGDLPNLLLTFPQLTAQDLRPWVNEQDALKKGLTADRYAGEQAEFWKKGLASWGQDAARIQRLRETADFSVYTPGSSAGQPLCVLRSFAPPPPAVLNDVDLLRDRIQTTATSLLALMGMEADPISSREHILIANILNTVWLEGRSLDLAGLIQAIQTPPFERVGIMDMESFYPSKERFALAMRLNNLLAAPGFEAWLQGDALDINRMLFSTAGKPRASVITISHLSDTERMFFVSMLLNEVLGWMRTQTGTTSLRAILYMDEIFGFFPPVQNPPSKAPLLTLLKQARAFGLGVVLSTQNPVDLDYKGLSNTGTWFIGRLQTERDKDRVLSGLEGAAAGSGFDRSRAEEILAGLGQRVFYLHNVHENQPAIFQTRWTLSYLAGPMSREQIKQLTAQTRGAAAAGGGEIPPAAMPASAAAVSTAPPVLPPDIDTYYLRASGAGQGLMYYPAVLGRLDIRYANPKYRVDSREEVVVAAPLEEGPVPVDWDQTIQLPIRGAELETSPLSGGEYAQLPPAGRQPASYDDWSKDLLRWIRQNRALTLYRSKKLKTASAPGESEADFRARLAQALREKRDLEVEKLRRRYSSRFTTLRDRLMRAEQVIAREQEQAKSKKVETAISFGTAILGAFLGRKAVSATSASRMGTAMKSAGRMQKEKMDVARAQERANAVQEQIQELEQRLQDDIDSLEASLDAGTEELEEVRVLPTSRDIALEMFGLVWLPYRRDTAGHVSPDW